MTHNGCNGGARVGSISENKRSNVIIQTHNHSTQQIYEQIRKKQLVINNKTREKEKKAVM